MFNPFPRQYFIHLECPHLVTQYMVLLYCEKVPTLFENSDKRSFYK